MRLAHCIGLFTTLSLALGIGSALSPAIAELGWLLGTAISLAAGVAYGLSAECAARAAFGGMLAGGAPILIGCAVPTLLGPVEPSGLAIAVGVGVVSGGLAASLVRAARVLTPRLVGGRA